MCIFCSLLSKDDVPCEVFEKKCKAVTSKYVKIKKVKDNAVEVLEEEEWETC